MEKEPQWIFFDLDGTLLYARGAGRLAFRQAFTDALGWDQGVEHINFNGATDLDVLRRIAADRGETLSSAQETAFFEQLGLRLGEHLAETPATLFPNVVETVSRLSRDWNLGVVTGNVLQTARHKLQSAGLLDYFDPKGFGCGCDHPDRVQIARIAKERAGNPTRAALIGDTPRDIAAALANGMTAIGVATGVFDRAALEAAGADFVFDDFSDERRVFDVLEGL